MTRQVSRCMIPLMLQLVNTASCLCCKNNLLFTAVDFNSITSVFLKTLDLVFTTYGNYLMIFLGSFLVSILVMCALFFF